MTHDTTDSNSIMRRHLLAGGLTLITIPLSGCVTAVANAFGREPPYTTEDVDVNAGEGVSMVDITKVETMNMIIGGKQLQVTSQIETAETGDYRIRLAALDGEGTLIDAQSETATLYADERSTFLLFTNHGGDTPSPEYIVLYVLPESHFEEMEQQ